MMEGGRRGREREEGDKERGGGEEATCRLTIPGQNSQPPDKEEADKGRETEKDITP